MATSAVNDEQMDKMINEISKEIDSDYKNEETEVKQPEASKTKNMNKISVNINISDIDTSDSDDYVDDNSTIDIYEVIGKFKNRKGFGYFTQRGIEMYLKSHPKEYQKNGKYITSLKHDPNTLHPLYFWQLYSLLGYDKVHKIISSFYKSIFNDKNAENQWFKNSFSKIGSLQHHIRTQVAFWLDAFGAGRKYHGGDFRLDYHHRYNAGDVMNEKGAKLWMKYMRDTLDSNKVDLTKDPRVRPAINQFLQLMMNKYAHDFKFNANDIEY